MSKFLISSHRGRPGNDPIFALSKMAADRKKQGGKVVNATLGVLLDDEERLFTLPTAVRAIHEVSAEQIAAYAPIGGAAPFLEAIRKEVSGGRTNLQERSVVVATPGGTGALRHAITAFVDEGKALLTSSFYWGPYATIASEHDRKVRTFSMFNEAGAFDVIGLEASLRSLLQEQGSALLLLNDPCHNPTGYSMSEEDWEQVREVLERCAELGAISVVLDSAYAAFSEGSMERPIRALESISDRVLVGFCWSASKTFLLYGQRVGALMLVPPDKGDIPELEAAMLYASRGTWSNCNHAGQIAASRLLSDPQLRPQVDAERAQATKLLDTRVAAWNQEARSRGLRYPRYEGGFFVTVMSSDPQTQAAALRERDIFVVPMAGSLRVALCSVPTTEVARLAKVMGEIVR
ncbi:MAG: aminotransferase class I/II-fold pyridoxal phosphate-dependent enzyme [Myxococcales bacterium]|nr:aminotransferase class I/II-fold pyridoxal phosphate-dependent enzyme [Polyangiaceae bacterium]MDW8249290.1 aminotransferase class I/II-fold pyridoxal phosphate-dependent enzyme [Myxococcales bacterium]